MNQKYKLISFEGVDGSGKTTLAKLLANEISGYYRRTPPELITPLIREHADASHEEKLGYFQKGNLIASQEIEELLKKGHVCLDRYFHSTQAYFGVKLGKEIIADEKLLKPDAVVYLAAEWPIIEQRLSSRQERTKEENLPFLKQVSERYNTLLSPRPEVIKVDTSHCLPLECIYELRDKLRV